MLTSVQVGDANDDSERNPEMDLGEEPGGGGGAWVGRSLGWGRSLERS